MSRWAIYLRVSTSGQEENGVGLDVQEQLCRAWLNERGLLAGEVYVDVCSGALMERDRIADMLIQARQTKDIAGVIFARLDRLARDVLVQEYLLNQFVQYGIEAHSVDPNEDRLLRDGGDDDDPTRKLVRVLLGAVAEFERKMIAKRTAAARRNMRARGLHAGGATGNGFYVDDTKHKRLRAELVPLVEDALRMRKLGFSLDTIAEFWLQSGWRTTTATGSWTPKAVSVKLIQCKKLGYTESARLSAGAALFTGGRR